MWTTQIRCDNYADTGGAFSVAGFTDLTDARKWVRQFVSWYNEKHRHSEIRYVTPAQRHVGHDLAILARRHALYQVARAQHPARWSGKTRSWQPVGSVRLNPKKETTVIHDHSELEAA